MTCLSDLFGANEPTFLGFCLVLPPIFTPTRHPTLWTGFMCRVATRPHGISGFGYRVETRISPKKSGIGCRVSLGCNALTTTTHHDKGQASSMSLAAGTHTEIAESHQPLLAPRIVMEGDPHHWSHPPSSLITYREARATYKPHNIQPVPLQLKGERTEETISPAEVNHIILTASAPRCIFPRPFIKIKSLS
jgi:hypothetical protein